MGYLFGGFELLANLSNGSLEGRFIVVPTDMPLEAFLVLVEVHNVGNVVEHGVILVFESSCSG